MYSGLFLKVFFIHYLCVCVGGLGLCVFMLVPEGQKGASDALELELQEGMRYQVLGLELGSSERAANFLNCSVISPALVCFF